MKTLLTVSLALLCLLPAAYAEPAGEPVDFSAEWVSAGVIGKRPRGWVVNSRMAEGEAQLIEEGNSLALQLKSTGTDRPFHLYSREYLNVGLGDVIRVRVALRGSGEATVMIYAYDAAGGYLGEFSPEAGAITLDSAEEFREVEFSMRIAPLRKGTTEQIRLAFIASPGTQVELLSPSIVRFPADS